MPKLECQRILTEHNLYASFSELKRIKQAIVDGRLWEHLEMRAHGHPALFQALKRVKQYSAYLEKHSPVTKHRGLFFFNSLALARPEVVRHRTRLLERYSPPSKAKVFVLLPQTRMKPFHRSREHQRAFKAIRQRIGDRIDMIHICSYAAPFGIIPRDLGEVFPLSQYEIAGSFDHETLQYVATQVGDYLEKLNFKKLILLQDLKTWKGGILRVCRRVCRTKNLSLTVVCEKKTWGKHAMVKLTTAIQRAIAKYR